jgi:hypothetical protein
LTVATTEHAPRGEGDAVPLGEGARVDDGGATEAIVRVIGEEIARRARCGAAAKHLQQQRRQVRRREPIGQHLHQTGDARFALDAVQDVVVAARHDIRRSLGRARAARKRATRRGRSNRCHPEQAQRSRGICIVRSVRRSFTRSTRTTARERGQPLAGGDRCAGAPSSPSRAQNL